MFVKFRFFQGIVEKNAKNILGDTFCCTMYTVRTWIKCRQKHYISIKNKKDA